MTRESGDKLQECWARNTWCSTCRWEGWVQTDEAGWVSVAAGGGRSSFTAPHRAASKQQLSSQVRAKPTGRLPSQSKTRLISSGEEQASTCLGTQPTTKSFQQTKNVGRILQNLSPPLERSSPAGTFEKENSNDCHKLSRWNVSDCVVLFISMSQTPCNKLRHKLSCWNVSTCARLALLYLSACHKLLLRPLVQALWGDIWKRAVRKRQKMERVLFYCHKLILHPLVQAL